MMERIFLPLILRWNQLYLDVVADVLAVMSLGMGLSISSFLVMYSVGIGFQIRFGLMGVDLMSMLRICVSLHLLIAGRGAFLLH